MDSVTVHTWGRNPNTTLGHDRTRDHPERLDLSLPPGTHVVQVSYSSHWVALRAGLCSFVSSLVSWLIGVRCIGGADVGSAECIRIYIRIRASSCHWNVLGDVVVVTQEEASCWGFILLLHLVEVLQWQN